MVIRRPYDAGLQMFLWAFFLVAVLASFSAQSGELIFNLEEMRTASVFEDRPKLFEKTIESPIGHVTVQAEFPHLFRSGNVSMTPLFLRKEGRVAVELLLGVPAPYQVKAASVDFIKQILSLQFEPSTAWVLPMNTLHRPTDKPLFKIERLSSATGHLKHVVSQWRSLVGAGKAVCTVTAVGPDLVLTAHHCLPTEEACTNAKIVFDDQEVGCTERIIKNPLEDQVLFRTREKLPTGRSLRLAALVQREPLLTTLFLLNRSDPASYVTQDCPYKGSQDVWELGPTSDQQGPLRRILSAGAILQPCKIDTGGSGTTVLNFRGHLIGIITHRRNNDGLVYHSIAKDIRAEIIRQRTNP